MRRCIVPGFVVLLFASCSSESGLSQSDPMQPSNPTDGGSSTACYRCFEDLCGWEASECASDPGCAGWLSCARPCPADGNGNPSATCLGDCPDPGSTTGRTLRDVFVGCLEASTGCCDGAKPEDGGAGGSGGTSGSAGSGGAGPDMDGGDAQPTTPCATDGCEACLVAIKEQKSCATGDDACASAMSDCYYENDPEGPRHCWSYLTSYARCAGGAPSPADGACSYEVPKDSAALTADGLACAATYCPQCIADPERQCVACQLDACPDEMAAVMSTLDAQELLWCRDACSEDADPPACNQACFAKHEAGTAAVIELYVCAQSACKDVCERT